MRGLILLALAPACVDYRLGKVNDEQPVHTGLPEAELCPLDALEASSLPLADACPVPEFPEGVDPYSLQIEWQVEDFMSMAFPVVGYVNDDAVPDIVVMELPDWTSPANLLVLSGDGSGELLRLEGFDNGWGPAIADVDGDGDNEIILMDANHKAVAIGPDGAVEWTSPPLPPSFYATYGQIIVADAEGDGVAEVIVGASVLSGDDGALLKRVILDDGAYTPVAADVDLDGQQELLVGSGVWDFDGTLRWATDWELTPDCTPAVAQLDADEEAEVLFVCHNNINAHEHDGALKWTRPLPRPGVSTGMPCVGDITGDGEANVVIPNNTILVALTSDGEELWHQRIVDSTSGAGCSLFDLNSDGVHDVLYGDEYELMVLDGRTGARLFSDPSRGSHTGYDYPVVADVDDDGEAEVVVVATGLYGGYTGVAVYGHPYGLPGAGPTWPSHDYDELKVSERGAVVPNPEPSWLGDNLFHGRVATERPIDGDLVVELDAVCAEGCAPDSPVHLRFRVGNQGPVDARRVHLALLLEPNAEADEEASPEVLREASIGPVPSGQMGATRSWTVPREVFDRGALHLQLTPVDQMDCDAENSRVDIPVPACEEA